MADHSCDRVRPEPGRHVTSMSKCGYESATWRISRSAVSRCAVGISSSPSSTRTAGRPNRLSRSTERAWRAAARESSAVRRSRRVVAHRASRTCRHGRPLRIDCTAKAAASRLFPAPWPPISRVFPRTVSSSRDDPEGESKCGTSGGSLAISTAAASCSRRSAYASEAIASVIVAKRGAEPSRVRAVATSRRRMTPRRIAASRASPSRVSRARGGSSTKGRRRCKVRSRSWSSVPCVSSTWTRARTAWRSCQVMMS